MPNANLHIAKHIGANARRYRARAGLSQEQAAIRASLHRTEIGLLERGERCPRIDTVVKLAAAVGTTVADLLDGIAWEPGESRPGSFRVTS
jgi:DNA-binding XRE family transcriptional regulator